MSEASSSAGVWGRVVRGDSAAFEQVVRDHQSSVTAVAYAVLGDFTASQDVAQETFLAAWRSSSELRDPRRLGGWLCGIARRLALQSRRAERRPNPDCGWASGHAEDAIDGAEDPASAAISQEQRELVWRSLESIPETYREVLVLYYRHQRSAAQVAEALDLSADAVRQRLSRGRDLLRRQVSGLVEEVLARTRPGRSLTARIMAAVAGGTAVAASSTTATAAGAAVATGAAAQAGAAGAVAGAVGGLLGSAGGLAGSWFGCWLPAQLAATVEQRRLIEQYGGRLWRLSLVLSVAIVALIPLIWLPHGGVVFAAALAAMLAAFTTWTLVETRRVTRQWQQLAAEGKGGEPNLSFVRRRWVVGPSGEMRWKGRRFRNSISFLGLPLVDLQMADPGSGQPAGAACGWIAIGDTARGVVAIGGRAIGGVALGGVSCGIISAGGLAVGLLSLGGLAVGGLAGGGLACGLWAVGGMAVGWDAAGGLALGWHSAVGGLAVAYEVACGGGAIARHFAVGGGAWAEHVNDALAHQAVAAESWKGLMDAYIRHALWINAILVALSLAPSLAWRLVYRRSEGASSAASERRS